MPLSAAQRVKEAEENASGADDTRANFGYKLSLNRLPADTSYLSPQFSYTTAWFDPPPIIPEETAKLSCSIPRRVHRCSPLESISMSFDDLAAD
jgi:hypothetical protein